MTADGKLILCIPIVFVMVSSALSVRQIDNNLLCYANVSTTEARNISYNETYRDSASWPFSQFPITKVRTGYKTESKTIWTLTQTCCTGYVKQNGTCTPECPSTCMNGYCAQPNICKCNYGWTGDTRSCNEPILCYIVQPDQVNSSETESKIVDLVTTDNTLIEWRKLPECPSEYLCHIHNEDINSTRSGNMTYYLVPIHLSCKAVVSPRIAAEDYNYIIGGVMGIIAFSLMAIGTVCFLRRRQRSSKSVTGDLTELVYNDVVVAPIPDHDVVNPTPISDDNYVTPIWQYGDANPAAIRTYKVQGTKPIDVYDDVATGPIRQYDDVNQAPIYDYDDVNRNPIHDYGVSDAGQSREYDYVTTVPIREYDDVKPGPIREYDDVKPGTIREYDDVEPETIRNNEFTGATPIHGYENVKTRRIYEYDDVGLN